MIRSKGTTGIVMPAGTMELGGEVAFIVAEPAVVRRSLRFLDVGLLRLHVRRSVADWLEIYVGTPLLIKQPSATHVPVWQGAAVGIQGEFAHGYATNLRASAGPLFGSPGWWYSLGPRVIAKPVAHQYLRFLLGLGSELTLIESARSSQPSRWLEELQASAEMQLGEKVASMWIGVDYHLPIAGGPEPTKGAQAQGIDPQVRLTFQVGGVLNTGSEDWDTYAIFSMIDRGEPDRPETMLPILDGGFDQTQIVVGVQHRFDSKTANR